MNKAELRKLFKEKRKSLKKAEIETLSTTIGQNILNSNLPWNDVKTVHTFLPIVKQNEIDTLLILDQIMNSYDLQILVPVSDYETNTLSHAQFKPGDELVLDRYGIPIPRDKHYVDPVKIDLIFTPLLAFDLSGYRVGYGKGFYDRFFTSCRANVFKLGLSLFDAVENIKDCEYHDIRLNACITPHTFYEF